MKNASYGRMLKVVLTGTGLVIIVYLIAATFGYLTWAGSKNENTLKTKRNILSVDYEGNVPFTIAMVSLLFAVIAAAPMCLLPLKDSFEALVFVDKKMSF